MIKPDVPLQGFEPPSSSSHVHIRYNLPVVLRPPCLQAIAWCWAPQWSKKVACEGRTSHVCTLIVRSSRICRFSECHNIWHTWVYKDRNNTTVIHLHTFHIWQVGVIVWHFCLRNDFNELILKKVAHSFPVNHLITSALNSTWINSLACSLSACLTRSLSVFFNDGSAQETWCSCHDQLYT